MWLFVLLFVCTLTNAELDAERLVDQAIDDESPGPLSTAVDLMFGAPEPNSSFWRRLLDECSMTQSFNCVKRTVHGVLNDALDPHEDLVLGESLVFARHENKYSREMNEIPDTETTSQSAPTATTESVKEEGRSVDSFESMSESLYERGVRFLTSHDLKLALPETFGGGILRISPRALSGGALVTVEHPQEVQEARFFGFQGKIKKKLMMSFMALLLIIKMIKVKLMYLAPLILGASAAKKLLLKVLLFIFPAFAHLFKFCAYYHASHAKFHHHHHQIAHHHHHVPVPVPVPVHHHSSPSHSLPHYPPSPHAHPPHDSYHPQSYEGEVHYKPGITGPSAPSGYDSEYLSRPPDSFLSRNDFQKTQNELASWGLSTEKYNPGLLYPAMPVVDDTQSAALIRATEIQLQAQHKAAQEQQAMMQQQELLKEQQAIMAQHRIAQEQQKHQQLQLKLKQDAIRKQQILLEVQHQTNHNPSIKSEAATSSFPVYDPFYSPLLQKIDQILDNIGYRDEGCRERLICSMYKRPAKFSPHSNLISTQLSKEPNELEKPISSNSAVVRFFRYMQAARDGQENKDCLNIYTNCSINTELN